MGVSGPGGFGAAGGFGGFGGAGGFGGFGGFGAAGGFGGGGAGGGGGAPPGFTCHEATGAAVGTCGGTAGEITDAFCYPFSIGSAIPPGFLELSGVAHDLAGNVALAGTLYGQVDFDGALANVGFPFTYRAFVAAVGPQGDGLWVNQSSFSCDFGPFPSLLRNATGGPLFGFSCALNPGTSALYHLEQLDPGGSTAWQANPTSSSSVAYMTVSARARSSMGEVSIAAGDVTSQILTRYSGGSAAWSKTIPVAPALRSAIDEQGHQWLSGGSAAVATSLGCPTPTSTWIAELDGAGFCLGTRNLGVGVSRLAFAARTGGGFQLAAVFTGTIDLDGAMLSAGSGEALALASYDQNGDLIMSSVVPTPLATNTALDFAADGVGGFVIRAAFAGTIDLGGGPLAAGTVLARFDSLGAYRWQRLVSGGDFRFDADACGRALVATHEGALDLGDGPLFVGGSGVGVLKIAP